MKTLREYRKKHKLTQSDLAEILKTSRSQINMTEQGKRELPGHAQERFNKLVEESIKEAKLSIESEMEITENDFIMAFEMVEVWQEMLRKNKHQQYELMLKIRKMQREFDTRLAKTKSLQNAVDILPEAGGAKIEISYIDDLQQQQQRTLQHYGKGAQMPFQLSLYLLKAEEKLLQQYLSADTKISLSEIIAENNIA